MSESESAPAIQPKPESAPAITKQKEPDRKPNRGKRKRIKHNIDVTKDPCPDCGQIHVACHAHRMKRDAEGKLRPCGARSAMQNGTCRLHGGLSPAGIASPRFKTGAQCRSKYTSYLAGDKGLLAKLAESQSDPKLLRLGDQIALVDARIKQLVARLAESDSAKLWSDLRAAHRHLLAARDEGDAEKVKASLDTIGNLIVRGSDNESAWAGILKTIEDQRKLIETEMDHMIRIGQMLSVEQAMMFIARITDIIKRNVTDRPALSAITRELGALIIEKAQARS